AELATCLAQLVNLGGLSDTCRLAMRDPTDAAVQSLIEKAQPSFAADYATALPLALARIGNWWAAATSLAHTDQVWFVGQSSALVRWLWSTIEAQRTPPPQTDPTPDAQAVDMLADITEKRFANDASVLNFAFASGQSNSAPPLLTLTGDA